MSSLVVVLPPAPGPPAAAEVGPWGNIPCVTALALWAAPSAPRPWGTEVGSFPRQLEGARSNRSAGVAGGGGGRQPRRAGGFHCSQRCPEPPWERGGARRPPGHGERGGRIGGTPSSGRGAKAGLGVAVVLGIPSCGGALGWARSSSGLAQPLNGAAQAPARKEGLAVSRGVCCIGWGVLVARGLGNGAGCGNGPDPATHKLTLPSRCGTCPPFPSAPQPLVGFPCQGPGCEACLAWGSSAPPHQPGAGGGGMCCSWAEAADAALLEITLLHARRQREKLLSRALSAQPALSARRGGGGARLCPCHTAPSPQ